MDKSLVIGMGEIGKAVAEVIGDCQTLDVEKRPIITPLDILHICFPYSENFINEVENYKKQFNPKHIVIYSTVPVGTTIQIWKAAHSPVEGRHPDLALSIRQMTRWVGHNEDETGKFFLHFFNRLGLTVNVIRDSDFTEFLKLRSTAKYGVNLVWADYEKRVADALDMPYEYIQAFDRDYNKLYRNLGEDWAQRYILDPPEGKIGGHCIVPNAKLLREQYPSDLLDKIVGME